MTVQRKLVALMEKVASVREDERYKEYWCFYDKHGKKLFSIHKDYIFDDVDDHIWE